MNDSKHTLEWGDSLTAASEWLSARGCRCLTVSSPGTFTVGVVFDSGPGTTVQMACMGDTLTWDVESRGVKVEHP